MNVKFRLPNSEFLEYTLTPNTTASDLVQRICMSARMIKMGIEPSRMSFEYKGKQLAPEETFESRGVESDATIDIILTFRKEFLKTEACYDPYIESISVANGEQNVPIDVQPLFQFQENANGLSLYLPSFANRDELSCDMDGPAMNIVLGDEEASKRGFIKWTDTIYPPRLLLLEVTSPYMAELSEKIRYNYFGINRGYGGADVHSWQRYSTKDPIPCYVYVEEASSQVRLVPEEPLQFATTYCIVLQNGMPTPPTDFMNASLFSFTGRGICEDKVLLFRTVRMKKVGRASMWTSQVVEAKSEDDDDNTGFSA
jgi:hypothetical protein